MKKIIIFIVNAFIINYNLFQTFVQFVHLDIFIFIAFKKRIYANKN